ncbi:tRNA pseudouridine(55) synthase TruB [Candidatus Saccharibacteria bacterium]|nr:tRNA pseudouridine(55) synthase TruB [Candidatus Saccharibacteria bacterium]
MDEILLIDKPAGMTSFGVVARVRRVLSAEARHKVKVGHTGTLDPFATGLLILMTGKMTRKCEEFLKLDKKYVATICLGKTSTTGDTEGEIRNYIFAGRVGSARLHGRAALELGSDLRAASKSVVPNFPTVSSVVKSFQGEIVQRVPAYSAVKINGKRAYDLARRGVEVEMPERKVTIYSIEILNYEWPYLKIACHVSSGTYIRTLGEDIGKKLGVGGYLTELRRTAIGKYRVEEARTLAELGILD